MSVLWWFGCPGRVWGDNAAWPWRRLCGPGRRGRESTSQGNPRAVAPAPAGTSSVPAGPLAVQSPKEKTAREEAVPGDVSVEMPMREAGEGGGRGREGGQTTAQAELVTVERRKVCAAPAKVMASHGVRATLPRGWLSEGTPAVLSLRGSSLQGPWPQCQWVLRAGPVTLPSEVGRRAGWPVPGPLAGTRSSSPSPAPLVTVQKYQLYVTFSPVCSCSYNLMQSISHSICGQKNSECSFSRDPELSPFSHAPLLPAASTGIQGYGPLTLCLPKHWLVTGLALEVSWLGPTRPVSLYTPWAPRVRGQGFGWHRSQVQRASGATTSDPYTG